MAQDAPFECKRGNPVENRYFGCETRHTIRIANTMPYMKRIYRMASDIGLNPEDLELTCMLNAEGFCPYHSLEGGYNNCPGLDGSCRELARECDWDNDNCSHISMGEYDGNCVARENGFACPALG